MCSDQSMVKPMFSRLSFFLSCFNQLVCVYVSSAPTHRTCSNVYLARIETARLLTLSRGATSAATGGTVCDVDANVLWDQSARSAALQMVILQCLFFWHVYRVCWSMPSWTEAELCRGREGQRTLRAQIACPLCLALHRCIVKAAL